MSRPDTIAPWRIKTGSLPSGLSLNQATGTIYGTPTAGEDRTFTIEVNDSDSPAQTAEKTFSMEVTDQLFISTKSIPNGRVDGAYTATIRAQLGTPPYSWQLHSGDLPPGLVLISSPTVVTIEGTSTTPGTYVFTLEVSDSDIPPQTATQEYTAEIYTAVEIETDALLCAYKGASYSDTVVVSGGQPPYNWQMTEGNLPDGLNLNSTTGQISGTADAVTGFSSVFTVKATDSGSPSDFDEKELVIYVINPLESFAAYFGRSDCAGDCIGDYDEDGDVDGKDLAVFISEYGNCP